MFVFEVLVVGIEASIALAGFSGIIATFQIRSATGIRRGTVASLTVVVQVSLLCALICAIPLLLHTFGVSGPALWTIGSLAAGGVTLVGGYGGFRNMRGALTRRSITLLFILIEGSVATVLIANVLNVANVVFHREPGPLVAAVLVGLSVGGYVFSRLLLLPLWRAVKEREAETQQIAPR